MTDRAGTYSYDDECPFEQLRAKNAKKKRTHDGLRKALSISEAQRRQAGKTSLREFPSELLGFMLSMILDWSF